MTISHSEPRTIAFSADVRLTLNINGREFALAEAGPNEVVLRHAQQIPIGPAELITIIDGQTQVRHICVASQADDRRTILLSK